jgi:hypothetical protein
MSLPRPNIGFNPWQPPVRPHFRPAEGPLGGGGGLCMWCRRLDKIDLAELTPVQVDLFAPLFLSLALVLTVSGDDSLVVDIRLHPRLPAVRRYEGRVVEGRHGPRWLLLAARRLLLPGPAGDPARPVPRPLCQVGLDPRGAVRRPAGRGEPQRDRGGGDRGLRQAAAGRRGPGGRRALPPPRILVLGEAQGIENLILKYEKYENMKQLAVSATSGRTNF